VFDHLDHQPRPSRPLPSSGRLRPMMESPPSLGQGGEPDYGSASFCISEEWDRADREGAAAGHISARAPSTLSAALPT
jgi:hypothetical protein